MSILDEEIQTQARNLRRQGRKMRLFFEAGNMPAANGIFNQMCDDIAAIDDYKIMRQTILEMAMLRDDWDTE